MNIQQIIKQLPFKCAEHNPFVTWRLPVLILPREVTYFIHVCRVLSIIQVYRVTLKCSIKRKTAAANNAVCFCLYHGSRKNKFFFFLSFPRYFFFPIVSRNVSNFVRVKSEDQDFPIKPFCLTFSSGSSTCSLIYSFIKYLLSVFHVPVTALSPGITYKQTDKTKQNKSSFSI